MPISFNVKGGTKFWKDIVDSIIDESITSTADGLFDDVFDNKKDVWQGEPVEQPKMHIDGSNIVDGDFEEIEDEPDEFDKIKINMRFNYGLDAQSNKRIFDVGATAT